MRKMLDVPADPSGERAVLIIVVEGGEVAPFGIVAGDFGDAGFEIDAEPLPKEEIESGARRRARDAEARAESGGNKKEGEEAGFEKHAVRLIAGKISGGADKREKTDEADDEHGAGPEIEKEQDGGRHANPAKREKHVRAAGNPENGWRIPIADEADLSGDIF